VNSCPSQGGGSKRVFFAEIGETSKTFIFAPPGANTLIHLKAFTAAVNRCAT
jgi:hypothetical protein